MKKFIQKLKKQKTHSRQRKINFRSKKFLLVAAVVVALLAGGIFAIFQMQGTSKNDMYKTALSNVSEARHYMKSATTASLDVQFFSGMREEPYSQNGIAGKPTAFAIINVDSKDGALKGLGQIEGTVKIGEEQVPIMLTRNPYDPNNFAADIGRLVDAGKPVEVTLFITNTNHPTLQLVPAFDDKAVSWKDALRVATNKVGGKLKGTKNFEVHVKIINNVAKDSGAFWYIQFITDEGKTYFCVVAPDGSVIG